MQNVKKIGKKNREHWHLLKLIFVYEIIILHLNIKVFGVWQLSFVNIICVKTMTEKVCTREQNRRLHNERFKQVQRNYTCILCMLR